VSPCQTGIKASTALLQAARQQLPLTQRSALQAASSSSSSRRVVKVTTWQQLVDAVESAAGDGASAGWRVFELQPGTSLVASRPLTLQPGMAVVAAGSGQGSTARKVQVSCQQGVASAFVVDLTSSSSSRWVRQGQSSSDACMQAVGCCDGQHVLVIMLWTTFKQALATCHTTSACAHSLATSCFIAPTPCNTLALPPLSFASLPPAGLLLLLAVCCWLVCQSAAAVAQLWWCQVAWPPHRGCSGPACPQACTCWTLC
jgi:hypothetical protein